MRRVHVFAAFAALAVLLAGCAANLEKAIIGKFRGEIDVSAVPASDKAAAEMGATMMKGITFELKEGGKAAMTAMGMNEEGTWKLEGNKLTISGKRGDPMKLVVEDGGKKLVPEMTEDQSKMFKGAKVWFKKE